MRKRLGIASDQHGFSLIELLVVILVIGILAAIAIPVFLNQKSKATGASGREAARAAAQAAEAYATDHSGEFSGLSPAELHKYEVQVQIVEGNNNSWVSSAESTAGGKGFTVTAKTPAGDTFTWRKEASGVVTRSCEAKAGNGSGSCSNGSW